MPTKLDELFFEISVKKGAGADRAIANFVAQIQRTTKATKKAAKASNEQARAQKRVTSSGKTLGKTLRRVVAAFGGFLILRQVIKSLREFETRMAEISTISGENIFKFEQLRDSILRMSKSLPKSPADLAAGAYQVISAGVTEASDALLVLRASATAATAGLADTKVAVDAVTTVLNAFGLSALDAARVSDVLFKTVEQGKVTFPELASTIGNVATSAGLAGITIEELSAGIATMTKFGVNAAEATTALNRLFLTLVQQTDDQKAAFEQLGIEFNVATVKEKGLAAVIAELNRLTDGQIELLAELFPNIRAARAAFVLAGDGAGEYARILAEAQSATGAATVAAQKMTDTFDGQYQLFKNNINVGIQNLARNILPGLGGVLEDIANIFVSTVDREIAALDRLGLEAEATIARLQRQVDELTESAESSREQAFLALNKFFLTRGQPQRNIAEFEFSTATAEENAAQRAEVNRLLTEEGALQDLINQKREFAKTASAEVRVILADQVEFLEGIVALLEAAVTAENELSDATNVESQQRRDQLAFLDRQLAILKRIGDEDTSRVKELQTQRDILASQQEVAEIDIVIRDLKLPDATLAEAQAIITALQEEINAASAAGDIETAEAQTAKLENHRALITLLERQIELQETIGRLQRGEDAVVKSTATILNPTQVELQQTLANEVAKATLSAAEAQLVAIDELERRYLSAFKAIDEEAAVRFEALRQSARRALDAEEAKSLVEAFNSALQSRLDEIEFDFLESDVGDDDALRRKVEERVAAFAENARLLESQLAQTGLTVEEEEKLTAEHLKVLQSLRAEKETLKDINEEESTTLKLLDKQLRDRLALVGLLRQASDGILSLADAFGLVNDETRKVLEGVQQIASSALTLGPALAKFQAAGTLTSFLPVASAGLGALGGASQILSSVFGESPEEKRRKEILKKNTDAIHQLTKTIGEFGLVKTPGREFTGIESALQGTIGAVDTDGNVNVFAALAALKELPGALARLGLSMSDLVTVAKDLGITFADETKPTFTELQQALEAISQAEITQFAQTFQGQMTSLRAEFELFDITNPIEQLQLLQKVFGDPKFGSPALRKALGGLDLSTSEGRAQAQTNVENLFRLLQSGGLSPEQLGGLSPQEFLDALLEVERQLDAGALSSGDTQDVRASIQITELQANQLLAFQSTLVFRAEERNALLSAMLSALTGNAINVPIVPVNGTGGGGNITVQVGPNNFTLDVDNPLGDQVEDFVDQVATQLGEKLQDRAALFGDTI